MGQAGRARLAQLLAQMLVHNLLYLMLVLLLFQLVHLVNVLAHFRVGARTIDLQLLSAVLHVELVRYLAEAYVESALLLNAQFLVLLLRVVWLGGIVIGTPQHFHV